MQTKELLLIQIFSEEDNLFSKEKFIHTVVGHILKLRILLIFLN